MKHMVDTVWKGQMKFEAELDGHKIGVDAGTESGGEDTGPRPKKLMLLALAGCSGMDVVSILQKMRVPMEALTISVEADVTEEHPKHYTEMKVIYRFKGKELDRQKLEKAVRMSQEQYCGVAAAYKKGMTLSWEIVVED
jgi:putative redox protein